MNNSSGNVLFLILIAVALFAALSYAITNSNRSGGKNTDKETASLSAARILQNLALMTATIDRMTISGNRTVEQLDMTTPNMAASIGNLDACVSDTCNLFHVNGGKVIPELPAKFIRKGSTCDTGTQTYMAPSLMLMSIQGVGTDEPDVVIEYICMDYKICDEINEKLGLWKSGDPYLTADRGAFGTGFAYFRYTGYQAGLTVNQIGSDTRLVGQTTFCGRLPAGTTRSSLYHVLKAR